MICLITGGTGFIGSRIVRDLTQEGENVVIYDWLPDIMSLKRALKEDLINKKITIVQGDITDYPHLLQTLKENQVTHIIHMAALLTTEVSANPPLAVKINCEGTVNVFEAAKFLGVGKVVWASSSAVFGKPSQYCQEYIPNDAAHYPLNIYGAAKSFNEVVANHYCKQYGMDITALRYVAVYGAGEMRGASSAIMQPLVYNPAIGVPGTVPASENMVVGWSYVDDVARATVLALRAPKTRTRAFSIMGEMHTLKEVAEYVKKLIPLADIKFLQGCSEDSGISQVWKYETKPIEEELGYRPVWTLERGIRETINTVRYEHGMPPV